MGPKSSPQERHQPVGETKATPNSRCSKQQSPERTRVNVSMGTGRDAQFAVGGRVSQRLPEAVPLQPVLWEGTSSRWGRSEGRSRVLAVSGFGQWDPASGIVGLEHSTAEDR